MASNSRARNAKFCISTMLSMVWNKQLLLGGKSLTSPYRNYFKHLYTDASLFVCWHADGTLLVMIAYVDNILFIGPNKSFIASKKVMFMELWECCDLGGCKKFLCICVERRDGKIYLNQTIYLQKVLQWFRMTNALQQHLYQLVINLWKTLNPLTPIYIPNSILT